VAGRLGNELDPGFQRNISSSPAASEEEGSDAPISKEEGSDATVGKEEASDAPAGEAEGSDGDAESQPIPRFNCFAGSPNAWQLNESVPDFLSRLPPSTTDRIIAGFDWISIANPYVLPYDKPPKLGKFRERATGHLNELINAYSSICRTQWPPRMSLEDHENIDLARKKAVQEILATAAECNLTTGKWMHWVQEDALDEAWAIIAEATARNELGTASEVATKTDKPLVNPILGPMRLVCVHTRDFRDLEDVARVLRKLLDLGLFHLGEGGSTLYYKTDAFTRLNILGGNKIGIPASLYASTKIIAQFKITKSEIV